MRSFRLFPLTLLIILAISTTALAWSKPGHMLTGAIAYYELKAKDPTALEKVINLLKKNPYYQAEWLPRIQTLGDSDPDHHDLYLFMYAARWPDDIRGIPSLHCDPCHYINYPFKPANQPASLQVNPPANTNILTRYKKVTTTLQSSSASQVAKSRALCWVFHLIGDVHQPLHTSTLFTVVFPIGDRGGTRFYIAEAENEQTKHLHSFWDGLVMSSQQFSSVRNRARNLLNKDELKRQNFSELSETRFDWWAKESLALAKKDGYLMGQLEGSPDELDGAVLPEDYKSRSEPIAVKRAMLAGYRLADLLSQKF